MNRKKEKEELQIKFLKGKIEMEKLALDRYVNVLVRSAFIESCTGGAYFNELFSILLTNGHDELYKSKLPKKEIDKLQREWFPLFHIEKTELERLGAELKYHKRLTGWAEYSLKSLNEKKKEEIIRDSIKQVDLWSEQFNRNSKLYEALNKKKNSQRKT